MTREFHPDMKISMEDGTVRVERPNDERKIKGLHGLTRALINNMVIGVTKAIARRLKFMVQGIGLNCRVRTW